MKALEPEMIFPGEEIVHVTGYHWIYVFRAFMPFAAVLVIGTIVWSFIPTRLTSAIILLALLASIGWIIIRIFDTIVKRCYVTTRRLINRKGWTTRDIQDVTLDRIGGIYLDQTPLERFLGYGRVKLLVPVIEIPLPEYLRNPTAFRQALYPKKAAKPAEKPDDEALVEEDARIAQERDDDDRFGAETGSLKELQEASGDFDGDGLGADIGADLGADLSQEAQEAANAGFEVDESALDAGGDNAGNDATGADDSSDDI